MRLCDDNGNSGGETGKSERASVGRSSTSVGGNGSGGTVRLVSDSFHAMGSLRNPYVVYDDQAATLVLLADTAATGVLAAVEVAQVAVVLTETGETGVLLAEVLYV